VSRGAAQRLLAFLPPRGSLLDGDARGSPATTTLVGYAGVDAAQQPCSAGDAPLSQLPKAMSVELLFDVSDVFATSLEAPRMSEVRLRQALPSLVEERLLTDAADCHLAYRIESTEGSVLRVAVAAIDRVTLTRAQEAVAESHLQPRSAYSALYSIPAPAAGTLSVRVHRGRGTVRTAEHSGFAFDVDEELPAALPLAVQQLGILRIEVYGRDAAKLLAFAPQLGVEVVDLRQDFDPASTASALNLLQGRYAPAGRFGLPGIASVLRSSQIKPVLTWAAGWLAIFVIGLNAYSWKLESEARTLRSSMQTAFRSAFPNESLVDTVAQTKIHLRELRARSGQSSPDDFSVLNAQAAQLLAGAPVGALAGLDYRDAALTLKFKPGTASSSALQSALRTQAAQQGLNLRFDADGSARVLASAP
jgi:general secretion pathway protein L